MMKRKSESGNRQAIPRRQAPLALAVAIALGSPTLHAQIQPSHILAAPSTEQLTSQVKGIELVVIDAAVEDRASLLKAVPHGAEWLVLDSQRDGVEQLAEIAARYSNIRALHLLSHGEDGLLKLGNSVLNQQNIDSYHEQLNALASAMTPGADLLLYGCEVARTDMGKQFITALKASTGLDIAASNDITRDGEWELEIARGSIESQSLRPEGYQASLVDVPTGGTIMAGDGSGGGGGATFNYVDAGSGGAGGGDNDTVTGTTGNDILFGDGSGGGGGGSKYRSPGTGGTGGGGDDVLTGGAGNDILFGDGFDGRSGSRSYGGDGGYGGGGGGGNFNGFYDGAPGTGGVGAGNGGNPGEDGYAGYSSGGAAGDCNIYICDGGGGGWSGSDGTTAGNGGNYYATGVAGHIAPAADIPDDGTIHTAVMEQLATLATLPGGAGADILDGGPGSDELFGMGGADTFKFEVTDAPAGNSDTDTIHDFATSVDTIQLLNNSVLIRIDARDTILANQTATPTLNDRTLVYTVGDDSVTIIVKNVGNDLTASDVPALPNTDPTVNPSIDEAVAVGGSFTVSENGFDAEGDTLSYSYQWISGVQDIDGATAPAFTPTIAEAHTDIAVTVTADDGYGGTSTPTTTTGVTVVNSDPSFDTTPSINGTAIVGSQLSVINTATSDADGDSTTLSYQWNAGNDAITGATNATFTPTAAEAHAQISVTVTAYDGYDGSSIPITTAEVTVANSYPDFDAIPSISGTAAVGSLLSAINTATSDADDDAITLSYQWNAGSEAITGATDASFTPTVAEAHAFITVTVTADDGYGGTISSTTSGVTVANTNPVFDATPSISGDAIVGSELSVINTATSDADGDSTTLSYQWYAGGEAIAGATSATFTPTAAEADALISVTVTAYDGYGGTATVSTSAVTVSAKPSSDSGGSFGLFSWIMGLLLLAGRGLSRRKKDQS